MAHQDCDDGVKVKRSAGHMQAEEAGKSRSRIMTYEYGKPPIGMALGAQRLFPGDDADWETRWEASEPDATATLWRYTSFAKFCSLLERRELFFSLVGDMEDSYEGFCQRRSKSTPLAGVKMHHLMRFSPALAVVPVVHRRDARCFV